MLTVVDTEELLMAVVASAPADPSANKGLVYIKSIDGNNDGIFIKVKKAGSYVEVQIA